VIAALAAGQNEQMLARRIRDALLRGGKIQRQLGSEHRRDRGVLRRLRKTREAVKTIVVRERKRLQTQPLGLLHQRLGRTRPVQKRER
jgi:hypothetical protein